MYLLDGITAVVDSARVNRISTKRSLKFSGCGIDLMSLNGPLQDGATEFMFLYRLVPEDFVPVNLRNFILDVSLASSKSVNGRLGRICAHLRSILRHARLLGDC